MNEITRSLMHQLEMAEQDNKRLDSLLGKMNSLVILMSVLALGGWLEVGTNFISRLIKVC